MNSIRLNKCYLYPPLLIIISLLFIFPNQKGFATITVTDGPFIQEVVFHPVSFSTPNFSIGAASDRLLIATITHRDGGITDLTYDGMPLTEAVSHNTSGPSAHIFYLVLPGSAAYDAPFTIVTPTGVSRYLVLSAIVVSGANTSSPLGAIGTNTTTGSPGSITLSTSSDNFVVDAVASSAATNSYTVGANQTILHTANNHAHASSYEAGTTSSTEMSWTWTGGGSTNAHVAVEFVGCPSCPPGNLTLASQAEIDDFATDYPGCTEISGDLTIQESVVGNITNLTGLSQLTNIDGSLTISTNTALSSLNGLGNITDLGAMVLVGNEALNNLNGLGGLTTIDQHFNIVGNPGLTDLTGLSNLTTISGGIQIEVNPDLISLNGLNGLTSLNNLTISNNGDLTSLAGLNNVTSINGGIGVNGNTDLPNLDGLNGLTSINNDLTIEQNSSLTSLNGLDNLNSIGGPLKILSNSMLTNLSALSNLTTFSGDLNFDNNDAATNLSGLTSITTMTNLIIIDNDALSSVSGLDNLTTLYSLELNNNDVLTDLSALSNITSFSNGSFNIFGNASLTSLNGLDNIDHTTLGNMFIQSNPNLAICEVQSICDYLNIPTNPATISANATGCATRAEVETACNPSSQCLPGGITFSSQSDLNNFSTNYPGCTNIQGDVTIRGADINNLSPLSSLNSIGGFLYILDNPMLPNLDGLSSLTSVGGYLYIEFNPIMTNVNGLSALSTVGGFVYFRQNGDLADVDGLSSLTTVGGYLNFHFNGALANLEGLSSLTSVTDGMELLNNSSLIDLDGLSALTSLGGGINIEDNGGLISLGGLSSLSSIGGGLSIVNNTALPNLTGLSSLTTLAGGITVISNDVLTTLNGLENIDHTSITNLNIQNNTILSNCEVQSICDYLGIPANSATISGNATDCASRAEVEAACIECPAGGLTLDSQADIDDFATNYPGCAVISGHLTIQESIPGNITSLAGLSQLTNIDGTLSVSSNSSLTSLNGLDNIITVDGLAIIGLSSLPNLSGLGSLTTIEQALNIYSNTGLTNLTGLSSIATIDDVEIIGNSDLISLAGLENITSIAGTIDIEGNPDLANLSGLDNLNAIGGYLDLGANGLTSLSALGSLNSLGGFLRILNNNSLPNLNGLEGLTSIPGDLNIDNNNVLTTFNGLNNITSVGGNFIISDHSSLTDLSTLASLTSIGGYLYIEQNAALASLAGLGGVASIGGYLNIFDNDLLTSLSALNTLNSISGFLTISNNDLLTSLNGLENIDHTTITTLTIQNNTNLSTCEVQSICDYLGIPANSATISGNASGCTSRAEVEAACFGGVITWNTGANGDWNTASNWLPQQVPTATDAVIIDTDFLITISSGIATARDISLSNGGDLTIGADATLNCSTQADPAPNTAINVSSAGCVLTNEGNLNISYPTQHGINLTEGEFNNTGNCTISDVIDVTRSAIYMQHGTMNNDATVNITDCATGISVRGINGTPTTLTNNGTINISDIIEGIGVYETPSNEVINNSVINFDNNLNNPTDLPIRVAFAANVFENNGQINFLNYSSNNSLIIGDGVFKNNSGGQLNGSGTIGAFNNNILEHNGGTISPGNSIGRMVVWDNQDLSNSIFEIEINGTSAGSSYDQVKINGVPTFGGSSTLNASFGYTPSVNDKITFIEGGGLNAVGTFTTVSPPLPSGWSLVYDDPGLGDVSLLYSVLPVELTEFSGTLLRNKTVQLNWSTASELNNHGFEISFSANAVDWNQIGFVNGNGNSIILNNYTFTHTHPANGINYYRLKQIDHNGEFSFSKTISINLKRDGLSIFPNPTSGAFTFISEKEQSIYIYNYWGQLVDSYFIYEDKNKVDLSDFGSGIYFIKTEYGETVKLVLK